MDAQKVRQVILEMRSAIRLSAALGTPIADAQLLRDWANVLEEALKSD